MRGKLLHIAKCVRPARLFVARLLDELRGDFRPRININSSMRSDFEWFLDFASVWNGMSVFPQPIINRTIVVDACLSGVGGATENSAYACDISAIVPDTFNISELEAINKAVAIQTFVGPADRGTTIKILCDNLPAVQVFRSGRGRNNVILEAARAAWMVQALYQVNIIFEHIPGQLNTLADALSRAHTSKAASIAAQTLVKDMSLSWIDPCLHLLTFVKPSPHRSTHPATGRSGDQKTVRREGARHERQQALSGQGVPDLLPYTQMAPALPTRPSGMHLHRVPECQTPRPAHHKELYRPHQSLPQAHGGSSGGRAFPGRTGHPGGDAPKRLSEEREASRSPRGNSKYSGSDPRDQREESGGRLDNDDVLRGLQTKRGRPPNNISVRPPSPFNKGRRDSLPCQYAGCRQGWEESPAFRPTPDDDHIPSSRPQDVPPNGGKSHPPGVSDSGPPPAYVRIPKLSQAYSGLIRQGTVGCCHKIIGSDTGTIYPPLPPQISHDGGI